MKKSIQIFFILLIPISLSKCRYVANIEKTEIEFPKCSQELSDYQIAIFALKSYENLTLESYWDVRQYTNGWGTKSFEGEVITIHEANRRTREEFDRVYKSISERYPGISRWHRLVLSVMDYNVGNFGKGLDAAIKKKQFDKVTQKMLQYVYTARDKNGNRKKLKGLIKRRKAEVDLFLADECLKQELGQKYREKVIKNLIKAKQNG